MNKLFTKTVRTALVGSVVMGIGYVAGHRDGVNSVKQKCEELMAVSERVGYLKALRDIAEGVTGNSK